jgi:hypothetical protein
MRKNKKGSLSLSVNAIVVLILAIVMLGLGLGFIRGMFSKVSTQVEQQVSAEPEPSIPSGSIPITLSRENVITRAGEKEIIKVSVYNPTDAPWTSVKPQLLCDTSSAISTINDASAQSANTKSIAQGTFTTYNLLVGIPSAAPSTYLCQMNMSNYVKDLTIKIIE